MLNGIFGARPQISNHYVFRACASPYAHQEHRFKRLDCALKGTIHCLVDAIRLALQACFAKHSAPYWNASCKCLQLAPVALTAGWISPKQVYDYKNNLGLQPNLFIRINDCITERFNSLFREKSRIGYDYPDPLMQLYAVATNPLLQLLGPIMGPTIRYVRV